jgi:hypothetical protein
VDVEPRCITAAINRMSREKGKKLLSAIGELAVAGN